MAAIITSCIGGSAIWGRSLNRELSRGCRSQPLGQRSAGHRSITCSNNRAGRVVTFHDRIRETRMAEEYLHDDPREILIVLGPKSSGKSALFENYKLKAEAEKKQSFLAVDCRGVNLQSPQDLGRELGMESGRLLNALPVSLRKFVLEAWPVLQQLKVSEKVADFTVALPELKTLLQKDIKSVGEVISYLNTVLSASGQEQAAVAKAGGLVNFPPVILIDEANKLATWGDEGKKDLQALLDWFLFVSKQKGQAHVVLVTSEYAFSDWLSERIPSEFVRIAVIGNFEEGDARSFFESEVGTPVKDADWEICYKLLGGNAGFLRRCAGPFRRGQDMSAALDTIVQPIKSSVRSAVNPIKDVGYTSAAFLTVARALLAADDNWVPTADVLMLLKALDPAVNENATLQALVRGNVVTVRPVSEWAFDIPRSAFGDGEELVMAPSDVHLNAWRMVLPPLIQAWEAKEAVAKKAAPPAGLWARLARGFGAPKTSNEEDSSGAAK